MAMFELFERKFKFFNHFCLIRRTTGESMPIPQKHAGTFNRQPAQTAPVMAISGGRRRKIGKSPHNLYYMHAFGDE
jgi:hypothetical protein